jgi:hypothetical protein
MKNLIKNIIIESLLLFEDEKHVKQLFTNWANKKSGNPELALSLMDDFLKYQKRLKRDFTSFSSAEEMKQSIDKVRQLEDEKQKSSDAVKIFENAEVLVIAANTHQASCRYAAGTKWCTGAEDTDEYWKRHNRTGTEFIWIFKNLPPSDPNYKFSLHIKWDKKYDWCNAVNRCFEKTPVNLTAQSAEQFPQYFDYKAVLGRCFKYHEQRLKNRVVKSSGGLTVKIKNHISDSIGYHFDFSFDAIKYPVFVSKFLYSTPNLNILLGRYRYSKLPIGVLKNFLFILVADVTTFGLSIKKPYLYKAYSNET